MKGILIHHHCWYVGRKHKTSVLVKKTFGSWCIIIQSVLWCMYSDLITKQYSHKLLLRPFEAAWSPLNNQNILKKRHNCSKPQHITSNLRQCLLQGIFFVVQMGWRRAVLWMECVGHQCSALIGSVVPRCQRRPPPYTMLLLSLRWAVSCHGDHGHTRPNKATGNIWLLAQRSVKSTLSH